MVLLMPKFDKLLLIDTYASINKSIHCAKDVLGLSLKMKLLRAILYGILDLAYAYMIICLSSCFIVLSQRDCFCNNLYI